MSHRVVAVLGCGSIGRRHLRNLRALGQEVVAFDPDPVARAAAAADAGGVPASDLDEVWRAQPDVVFVTSPPASHVPLAAEAVRHGLPVFLEKPLAHDLTGVDTLILDANRAGVPTMVGCNMRFHPGPATVQELLSKQAVGEVLSARLHTGSYLPGWRPWQDYRASYTASPREGGALRDCIHELDLAQWFFGPAKLAGAATLPARSLGLEVEGLAEVLLRHRSGTLSSIHLNFVQRDYDRRCQVVGSEATLNWDWHTGIEVRGPDRALLHQAGPPPSWEPNQMYLAEVRHFLAALDTGAAPMNPVEEAAATLRLALEARAAGQAP